LFQHNLNKTIRLMNRIKHILIRTIGRNVQVLGTQEVITFP
jgi:hypothetical protein